MYSDGLIERRGELITNGMERLRTAATAIARAGWPDQPAVTFASMLSNEERTDDVVVLCVNYAGITGGGITAQSVGTTRDGMATLHLEPVVESTPVARHWIAAHLRDLPADVSSCAALLTSELVTNAVLHAATPMCVTLHILPDRIRVDVADGNPVFPSIKDYGTRRRDRAEASLSSTRWPRTGASKRSTAARSSGSNSRSTSRSPRSTSPTGPSASISWADASRPARRADRIPSVSVRLIGIPVALLQKSSEEYEALFRELRLMKERGGQLRLSAAAPPRTSLRLGLRDRDALQRPRARGWTRCGRTAVDNKVDRFDWTLELPAVGRGGLRVLRRHARRSRRIRAFAAAADASGLADQRGRAPLVPLRAHRPAPRKGTGRLEREPVPRRAASDDRA